MAVPLAVPLGLSVGLGGLKSIFGAGDRSRARRIRRRAQAKFDANPFETPEEVLQGLTLAQQEVADTGLPGEELYKADIQTATGGTLQQIKEAATTPQEITGAATDIYEKMYLRPMRDLAIRGAQKQQQDISQLLNVQNVVGQYRTKEWEQNVLQPYLRAMQTAGNLEAAGKANLFSGISDIAGGIANFAMAGGFGKGGGNTLPDPNVGTGEGQYGPAGIGIGGAGIGVQGNFAMNNLPFLMPNQMMNQYGMPNTSSFANNNMLKLA